MHTKEGRYTALFILLFISLETCLCRKNVYTSWYKNNPYIFKEGNAMKGIFPDLLRSMVAVICGHCEAFGNTTVYFDRTKSGRSAIRSSENELKSMVCIF